MARDILGPAVTELREFLTASAGEFAAVTVRAAEPAFTVDPTTHKKTAADQPPFVVLSRAGRLRDLRTGVVRYRVMSKAYGVTPQQAANLADLISDCFHDRGPRVRSSTAIYDSAEEMAAQPDTDPDTGWASEIAFYRFITAAQAIA